MKCPRCKGSGKHTPQHPGPAECSVWDKTGKVKRATRKKIKAIEGELKQSCTCRLNTILLGK